MKYRMTRNQSKAFLAEKANQLYTHEISFDEYKAIEIEYIPLDLTIYTNIKPETEEKINLLFTEEDTDKHGNYMLRGFTYHAVSEMDMLNLHYGDYSKSLNFWAYNDEEMLLYTYCEGDTTLKLFVKREIYEAEKAEYLRWYKEET